MQTPTIKITDPMSAPPTRGPIDRLFLRIMLDQRDLPFVRLTLAMTFVLLPAAVAVFLVPRLVGFSPWILAVPYWALLFGVFFDKYILMLHNVSHRRLFKREWRWLANWITWGVGMLNGESPETYFTHHILMHHSEGNLPKDLSSTMWYRRDSLAHWLLYFFRFFFFIQPEMARYQLAKGRVKVTLWMIIGEWSFFALCGAMLWLSWEAALIVLVIPFLLCRVLMMAGNWGQHAFIDPAHPDDDYRSSITCINTRYNRRCFNDGYHIGHHLTASRHWSEMPKDFLDNIGEYAKHDAIVFEGIDFFQVWLYLMLGRYDWLAKHYVDLGHGRSKEEIIAHLKSRVLPIRGWKAATRETETAEVAA